MLVFCTAVGAIFIIVYVIVELLTGSPSAQGTPRYHFKDPQTGEMRDETLGEYTNRSASSGFAFFGPLIVALLIAVLLFLYASAAPMGGGG